MRGNFAYILKISGENVGGKYRGKFWGEKPSLLFQFNLEEDTYNPRLV